MVQEKSLASIHVLAGHTARSMPYDVLIYKGLRSHMKAAHVGLFRGGTSLVPWYAVTANNGN